MGIFRTALGLTGWTALGSALTYTVWTRKSKVFPVPANDYIFGTTLFARFNPNDSPAFHDICTRKVPLDKIRPELLGRENEGKLVEAFCAGVWSSSGYSIQRRYLERKWRRPETAHQLWDQSELATSSYDVGTQITDHFQVVSKTPESIIVRCGDSPLKEGLRADDGLFEMVAQVQEDEGTVEFGLKSVFFNSLAERGTLTAPPIDGVAAWLHQQYDKVLMETAIKKCLK